MSPADEPLSGSPGGPLWKEMLISREFSTYPPSYPARKPSLQVPFKEIP